MKSQLSLILSVVVLFVVHGNAHVVRRQAPLLPDAPAAGTAPATAAGPQQPPPAPSTPAADGPTAPSPDTETQARAALSTRGRPQPQLIAPQRQPIAPQPEETPSAPSVFTLPDGADLIIGQINGGFTCDDKIYGYYADTNNDCKIFHVCVPIPSEEGVSAQPPLLFSFYCNNGTLFNQEALVCDYAVNVDCSLATTFYSVNEEFGKIATETAEGRGPAPGAVAPAPGVPAPAPGLAPRANIPPPATAATGTPAATGSAVTPTLGGSAATPGVSASVTVPEASASVPQTSVSASVPGATVSVGPAGTPPLA